METKQVLIWRKDLRTKDGHKCRTGKIAAQLAHASMKAILDAGSYIPNSVGNKVFTLPMDDAMSSWLEGLFTKICVSCDSEDELVGIYENARDAGLHCSLIQDAGLTEFGGVPTYTAVAVGPGDVDEINNLTGELKLL